MATSQDISENVSEAGDAVPRVSLFFVVLAGVFITCLLCANIVAVKLIYPFGLLVVSHKEFDRKRRKWIQFP